MVGEVFQRFHLLKRDYDLYHHRAVRHRPGVWVQGFRGLGFHILEVGWERTRIEGWHKRDVMVFKQVPVCFSDPTHGCSACCMPPCIRLLKHTGRCLNT